jgi:hypothetical protein
MVPRSSITAEQNGHSRLLRLRRSLVECRIMELDDDTLFFLEGLYRWNPLLI